MIRFWTFGVAFELSFYYYYNFY